MLQPTSDTESLSTTTNKPKKKGGGWRRLFGRKNGDTRKTSGANGAISVSPDALANRSNGNSGGQSSPRRLGIGPRRKSRGTATGGEALAAINLTSSQDNNKARSTSPSAVSASGAAQPTSPSPRSALVPQASAQLIVGNHPAAVAGFVAAEAKRPELDSSVASGPSAPQSSSSSSSVSRSRSGSVSSSRSSSSSSSSSSSARSSHSSPSAARVEARVSNDVRLPSPLLPGGTRKNDAAAQADGGGAGVAAATNAATNNNNSNALSPQPPALSNGALSDAAHANGDAPPGSVNGELNGSTQLGYRKSGRWGRGLSVGGASDASVTGSGYSTPMRAATPPHSRPPPSPTPSPAPSSSLARRVSFSSSDEANGATATDVIVQQKRESRREQKEATSREVEKFLSLLGADELRPVFKGERDMDSILKMSAEELKQRGVGTLHRRLIQQEGPSVREKVRSTGSVNRPSPDDIPESLRDAAAQPLPKASAPATAHAAAAPSNSAGASSSAAASAAAVSADERTAELQRRLAQLENERDRWRERYEAVELRVRQLESFIVVHLEHQRAWLAKQETYVQREMGVTMPSAPLTSARPPPSHGVPSQPASAASSAAALNSQQHLAPPVPQPHALNTRSPTDSAITTPAAPPAASATSSAAPAPTKRRSRHDDNSSASTVSHGERRRNSKRNRPKAQALYDYRAENPKELSFKRGDVLLVINQDNSGWWLAMHPVDKRHGFVPRNYLRLLEEPVLGRTGGGGGGAGGGGGGGK